MRLLLQLSVLWMLTLLLHSATAETYLLQADGLGDFATIQTAVDAVVAGDVIELADGTYRGDGNRDINYRGKEITIRSHSGDPFGCVIDCQGTALDPHRGFEMVALGADAVLADVLITGGYVDMGGAITIKNSSSTILGCVFRGNCAAEGGGGIDCSDGAEPMISGCTFWANTAEYGGALCI